MVDRAVSLTLGLQRLSLGKQPRRDRAESASERVNIVEAQIALSSLDTADIGPMQPNQVRKRLLRQSDALAPRPDRETERSGVC